MRRDRDANGVYEHADAMRIMDAWWPRWVKARVPARARPRRVPASCSRDRRLRQRAQQRRPAPRLGLPGRLVRLRAQGPARVLGRKVRGPYSRVYCGRGSLEALPRGAAQVAGRRARRCRRPSSTAATRSARTRDQWCFDAVNFRAGRRRDAAADPLDQPPDVPAGERDPVAGATLEGIWLETASETFTARHDDRDAPDAERVLAQLEYARARLERALEVVAGRARGGAARVARAARRRAAVAPAPAAADRARGAPLRGRLGARARAARAVAAAAGRSGRRTSRGRWRC